MKPLRLLLQAVHEFETRTLFRVFDGKLTEQAVWLQTQNDAYLEILSCTLYLGEKTFSTVL
jgi:hypothetical protein